MKELFRLFWTFCKIGSVMFGGGYAMLPLLQREIVEKNGWSTEEEILNYYAVGQCTPGIIAVNVATFVGAKRKGVLGAICSTIGLITIPFIIICIIAAFIQNFADIPQVISAFKGVRVAVCALVVSAIVKLWKSAIVDKMCLVIFLVVFALAALLGVSPVPVVILAGVCGIIIKSIGGKKP